MIIKSLFQSILSNKRGRFQQLMMVGLSFILVLQFSSCMPVMKMIYGVHQPNYVSDQAVIKFAQRLGLEEEIYRVKNYTEENRKQYQYLGKSMPGLLLFNTAGHLTKFEVDCSQNLYAIAKLSQFEIDSLPLEGKSIEDFIGDTYVINTEDNEILEKLSGPLYVINFAEFAGLLNKDNVPALVESLSQRDDVEYVVLNIDYTVKK